MGWFAPIFFGKSETIYLAKFLSVIYNRSIGKIWKVSNKETRLRNKNYSSLANESESPS